MRRSGFSLVELSIVLVILGLLTGGVLTGQNLIRAAELRSVTSEFNQYNTAIMAFKDKYLAFPGDISNATDFWGAMTSGTCPNATGGTGTQTCSGDGNGFIQRTGAGGQTNEAYLAWQHLVNAGLIEGADTGIAGSDSKWHSVVGENVPTSKMGGAWVLNHDSSKTGHDEYFDGNYGNNLRLFGSVDASTFNETPALKPEEAWGIDKKLDDGMPALGQVVVRDRVGCAVSAAGTDLTTSDADAAKLDSKYNLQNESVVCRLVFRNLF